MNKLRQLSPIQLAEASKATGYLLELGDALNPELLIKLDTLHADLAAEIEDRTLADPGERRPAEVS